jgi:Leucine rich repeat
LILLTCFQSIHDTKAKLDGCESTRDIEEEGVKILLCEMTYKTSINTSDETISITRNESLNGLSFFNNKKMFNLPVNVAEKFPNIVIYTAGGCSLKEVLYKNFKSLYKLKGLNLQQNQIEKITSDTFVDLKELVWIYLSKFSYQNLQRLIFIFFQTEIK